MSHHQAPLLTVLPWLAWPIATVTLVQLYRHRRKLSEFTFGLFVGLTSLGNADLALLAWLNWDPAAAPNLTLLYWVLQISYVCGWCYVRPLQTTRDLRRRELFNKGTRMAAKQAPPD